MYGRFANLLRGRGFKTDAEYYDDLEQVDRQIIAEQQRATADLQPSRPSRRYDESGLPLDDDLVFVVECLSCGARFRRKTDATELEPHISPDGSFCDGDLGCEEVDVALSSDTVFVVECAACGKRFKRKRLSTKLKPHTSPDGSFCDEDLGVEIGSEE